jgi:hypothetical protein
MLVTTVPEAPINKDRHLGSRECHVDPTPILRKHLKMLAKSMTTAV